MKIVTVTLNPCLDKTFAVDQVVAGRKLEARQVRRDPGGGGINVARAIKELGGEPLALWSRGGVMGDLLRQRLREEGVPEQGVPVAGEVRENVIVGESSSGQQYRFGMPGPELSARERAQWLDRLRGLEPEPEYVVFSGSRPPGAPVAWYVDLVRSFVPSTRVLVDTKPDAMAAVLEVGAYLVKPNVRELGDLVGRELDDDDAIEEAAQELIGAGGVQVVFVSLGRAGALLVTQDGCQRLFAPTVRARSRVGAGDSTVGGCVLALARGSSLWEAACFGMAAGAAAVMTPGTALCRREDVERLHRHMGRRRDA